MLITERARTSKMKPHGLTTIIAVIHICAHHSGTHCVTPLIIGFHGRYVSHLDKCAAHCAVAAMLSFVKDLNLAKQCKLTRFAQRKKMPPSKTLHKHHAYRGMCKYLKKEASSP
jgi:hypothetical protein